MTQPEKSQGEKIPGVSTQSPHLITIREWAIGVVIRGDFQDHRTSDSLPLTCLTLRPLEGGGGRPTAHTGPAAVGGVGAAGACGRSGGVAAPGRTAAWRTTGTLPRARWAAAGAGDRGHWKRVPSDRTKGYTQAAMSVNGPTPPRKKAQNRIQTASMEAKELKRGQ